MSLNTLIMHLTDSPCFSKRYNYLLLYSVRTQFPSLTFNDTSEKIDWSYLIKCASLFAQSKDGQVLDMAYRICQTCMEKQDIAQEYHNACATIFDFLTNSPAISLSKEREYISDDYLLCVPIQCEWM